MHHFLAPKCSSCIKMKYKWFEIWALSDSSFSLDHQTLICIELTSLKRFRQQFTQMISDQTEAWFILVVFKTSCSKVLAEIEGKQTTLGSTWEKESSYLIVIWSLNFLRFSLMDERTDSVKGHTYYGGGKTHIDRPGYRNV